MGKKDRVSESVAAKDYSRRDLVKFSVAGALAASASGASAASAEIVEEDVKITMPDGTCDAAFIHPKSGAHAAILIWPDAFGLRPAMRDIGKRIAADGYSVLVPNPYYRAAPVSAIDLNAKT